MRHEIENIREEAQFLSSLAEELAALKDKMCTLLAETKTVKDQNAEVEAELARRDDLIAEFEKRVNSLKADLCHKEHAMTTL